MLGKVKKKVLPSYFQQFLLYDNLQQKSILYGFIGKFRIVFPNFLGFLDFSPIFFLGAIWVSGDLAKE